MSDYTDEEFSELVMRELDEQASGEEVEYLWSSIEVVERWRSTLAMMVRTASLWIHSFRRDSVETQQRYLDLEADNPLMKRVRLAYARGRQNEIDNIKGLISCAHARMIRIKLWRKQYYQAEETTRAKEADDGLFVDRTGVIPPSLMKAFDDQPWEYAMGLRDGRVIYFQGAELVKGGKWVHLPGADDKYTLTMTGVDFSLDRGVDIHISDIMWVTDAPNGS